MKKIKLLALDIDGVLTDGRTTLGGHHPERKRLAFQDLDAVNAAKRAGLTIALVTGESDGSVDLVAARTGVALVRRGAKDKLAVLKSLAKKLKISLSEICYVGDGNRDAPALAKVGLSFAPANATFAAKRAAHCILPQVGGQGAVSEAVRRLLLQNDESPRTRLMEKEMRKQLAKGWTGNRAGLEKLVSRLAPAALALVRAVESGHKIILCGDLAEPALAELFSVGAVWPAIILSSDHATAAKQVRALARPGDVLITINSKKNSPALAAILRQAESRGVESLGIFSFSSSNPPGSSGDWSVVCRLAHRTLAATV